MREKLVGVIGAGVMGTGVAQNLAQTGHEVVLIDSLPAALDKARATIARGVRMRGLFGGGTGLVDDVLARIRATADLSEAAGADFVIENVVEDVAPSRRSTVGSTPSAAPTRLRRQHLGDPDHPHRSCGGRGRSGCSACTS